MMSDTFSFLLLLLPFSLSLFILLLSSVVVLFAQLLASAAWAGEARAILPVIHSLIVIFTSSLLLESSKLCISCRVFVCSRWCVYVVLTWSLWCLKASQDRPRSVCTVPLD